MFAASRRLNACDFLLLGSSIALIVVYLWPNQTDRQWLEVRLRDGQLQRYSVPVNDPSLQAIKLRLKKWESTSTSRALRTARWHAELADYYCQIDDGQPRKSQSVPTPVAQVSFIDAKSQTRQTTKSSFWSELAESARERIEKEQARIEQARDAAIRPVTLGPVAKSVRSPLAYPIACFAALTTIGFAIRRQRVRPHIELACHVDRPSDSADPETISLRIPETWVRIRQPAEIVFWRNLYAIAVGLAIACLVSASLQ